MYMARKFDEGSQNQLPNTAASTRSSGYCGGYDALLQGGGLDPTNPIMFEMGTSNMDQFCNAPLSAIGESKFSPNLDSSITPMVEMGIFPMLRNSTRSDSGYDITTSNPARHQDMSQDQFHPQMKHLNFSNNENSRDSLDIPRSSTQFPSHESTSLMNLPYYNSNMHSNSSSLQDSPQQSCTYQQASPQPPPRFQQFQQPRYQHTPLQQPRYQQVQQLHSQYQSLPQLSQYPQMQQPQYQQMQQQQSQYKPPNQQFPMYQEPPHQPHQYTQSPPVSTQEFPFSQKPMQQMPVNTFGMLYEPTALNSNNSYTKQPPTSFMCPETMAPSLELTTSNSNQHMSTSPLQPDPSNLPSMSMAILPFMPEEQAPNSLVLNKELSLMNNTSVSIRQPNKSAGLELPPLCSPTSVPGLYSSTGFDMIGVLSRVVMRKNPQISIGPVDMSCSFVVSDNRKPDHPIVYVSETFERLTGYSASDCVGRNCRFLQSPDGLVSAGSYRRYVDNATIDGLKKSIQTTSECQVTLINYRKGGEPFINLVTMIPIFWDENHSGVPDYFVGFQVDLVDQPHAIMSRMKNNTYQVNYRICTAPSKPLSEEEEEEAAEIAKVMASRARLSGRAKITLPNAQVEASCDAVAVSGAVSVKGRDNTASSMRFITQHEESSISITSKALGNRNRKVDIDKNDSVHVDAPPLLPVAAEDDIDSVQQDSISTRPTSSVGSFALDVNILTDVSDKEEAVRLFYNTLVEQSDFVHAISLRGVLLYVSPGCAHLLEYEDDELIGRNLADFCHPGDLVSVMREIKESSNGSHAVNLVYRIRRKRSGYMWIEASGKCTQGEKAKGKKFVVLAGRERPVMRIHKADMAQIDGLRADDMWSKLGLDGLFLHVATPVTELSDQPCSQKRNPYDAQLEEMLDCSATAASNSPSYQMIGFKPSELVGKNLLDLVHIEDLPRARTGLGAVRAGFVCVFIHRMKTRQGESRLVASTLLPGDNSEEPRFALHRCSSTWDSELEKLPNQMRSFPATKVTVEADDEFSVLSPVRCTSWQYELHQLRLQNRNLRSELEDLSTSFFPRVRSEAPHTELSFI